MNIYDCCIDCEDRHPMCHGHCEKKAKADAENKKFKAHVSEGKETNEYLVTVHERIKKRRHTK